MNDERIGPIVEDESQKQPSQILAFDPAKRREPAPVDLDSPFFTIARPDYSKCDHRNRGVTLDTSTRRAICLCGVEIDNFDALLIYAHAQRRLINHAETIKEYERHEAEKKAKRPFRKRVTGFQARRSRSGDHVVGYEINLECGHRQEWLRRKPPRYATCVVCFRAARLKAVGVDSVPAKSSDVQI